MPRLRRSGSGPKGRPLSAQGNALGDLFGGGVAINEAGDVSFAATLTPPDDNLIEWGTGAFVAHATPLSIFEDGFETGDLSAWSLVVGGE